MIWLLKQKQEYYQPSNNSNQNKSKEIKIIQNLNFKSLKTRIITFNISYIFILCLFFIQISLYTSLKKEENLLSNSWEITIKMQGKDTQYLFGENFIDYPDNVYLNGQQLLDYHNSRIIVIDSENIDSEINSIRLVWNSNYLDSLQGLFAHLTNIIEIDFSNFDFSLITDMTDMLYGCESLKSIKFPNIKNTISLNKIVSIFYNCSSLSELDLSSFDTSKVTNMSFAFYGCTNLTSLNLLSFDTSEVIDMECLFYGLHSLENLNVNNFDTSKVIDMSYMFYECLNITSLDLSYFNTSSVIDMSVMFYECNGLKFLNLTNFDTSQVTNMEHMFRGCSSMTSLDISSFDTSNVEKMDYFFCSCKSLTSLDIKNFDTSKVTGMESMFEECISLESLDLSSFNTEKVENMFYMFYDCENLSSLDISSFNTQSLDICDYMFCYCYSLSTLNLSHFNTPSLTSFEGMFYSCSSLTSLDISNFNTRNIHNMGELFFNCSSLLSLDLSNFDTSNVYNMKGIFDHCSNLTSLDLTNFETSFVTNMEKMFNKCEKLERLLLDNNKFGVGMVENFNEMFSNCKSLISLNLAWFITTNALQMNSMFSECEKLVELDISQFDFAQTTSIKEMFLNCKNLEYINALSYNENYDLVLNNILDYVPENVVICINEGYNVGKLKEIIKSKSCALIDCSGNWKSLQKKIVVENNSCVESCIDFKYENNNKCYSTCPYGVDFCETETTNTVTTNILTTHQNDEAIKIFNTDKSINIISSEISTEINNKKSTSSLINNDNIATNTYINTNKDYRSILTSLINKIDINISDRPNLYPSLIYETYTIKESSNFELDIKDKNNERIYEVVILDKMKNYDISDGEEITIEGKDNFFYQITTSENEKDYLDENNNNTNKFSKIDLGECENILKDHYNINRNVSLIIVKFEKITNISTERSLQYEVYNPFNKEKLNLSICQNTTIDVYVPVVLSNQLQNLYNELKEIGYNLFDEHNAFYQDICTPFKSPNGTDVSLADRYNYYFNNNETLCQSNCKFSNYSMQTQYLKCECDISNSEIEPHEITKFTPNTVYQSFYDILKFSNYKVLKCYKLVFNTNSIIINKGSVIAIIYFLLYLIFFVIYGCKGMNQLKIELAKNILNNKINQNNDILNNKNIEINNKYEKNISLSKEENNQTKSEQIKIHSKSFVNPSNKKIKTKINNKNIPPKKKSTIEVFSQKKKSLKKLGRKTQIYVNNSGNKQILMKNKKNTEFKFSEINNENSNKDNDKINLDSKEDSSNEKLDNFELNNLDYDMAIKLDKRDFLEIYWSILKREHLIFFTFFVRNDYNIIYIKLSRFIFLICTDMALNVFFFADETMHKMFLDYGKYNFYQQIPQIVYSTLVSQLIELLLCFLSLTDKHFYQIKYLSESARYNMFNIIKCMKIKIAIFYIFTFIMFAFYWYAIACFCAVYENTQKAFIKDSISSFALGLLYPFVLYIIPATLRIIALRATKIRCSCIYSLSDVIPFF